MCTFRLVLLAGLLVVSTSFVPSMSASALATPSGSESLRGNNENTHSQTDSELSNEIPTNLTPSTDRNSSQQEKHLHPKGSRRPSVSLSKRSKNPMDNAFIVAIVNAILDHKEVIISKVVTVMDTFLSGLISEGRKLLHKFFPTVIPHPTQNVDTNMKTETPTNIEENDATIGVSQRRSDNLHSHTMRTPHAFSNSETNEESSDENVKGEDKALFIMPLVDKPVSYNDIVLAQRLLYDSIDAYNAWQEHRNDDNEETK